MDSDTSSDQELHGFMYEYRNKMSVRECVDRRNSRDLSKRGEELGRYVRELYESGAKMFSKDMFQAIEEELAKEAFPKEVVIRSMNGATTKTIISSENSERAWPDGEARDSYLQVNFDIYQNMVFEAEDQPNIIRAIDDDDKVKATRATTVSTISTRSRDTPASAYEAMQASWADNWQNWTQSYVCHELTASLESARLPKTITKIVCFGLGCPGGFPGQDDWEEPDVHDGLPSRRSMMQHAAAITMATVLGRILGSPPPRILAQDPAYTDDEKRLLQDVGIEVVDGYGSRAFTYVDEESVVYSCHPNIPVKQVVADIARPPLMVWNRVIPVEQDNNVWRLWKMNDEEGMVSPWTTDHCSPRVRALVEDYDEMDFPRDNGRFGDLKLYVRRD